jgi:hypothetical protein
VRVSAALAWLCLVEDPVPEALRTVLEDTVTDELDRLMSPIPWLEAVDDAGLSRILERVLRAQDAPDDVPLDPWAGGRVDDPPF